MKKLFLMITLCFQVSYANDFKDFVEQFYSIDNNAFTIGLEKKLLDAKRQAVVWIKDYYLFRKPYLAEGSLEKLILEKMASTLEEALLNLPYRGVKISDKFCGTTTQFGIFNEIIDSEIYFFVYKCNLLDLGINYFTQSFIHESNHAAASSINHDNTQGLVNLKIKKDLVSSESLATAYELKITNYKNNCVFSHNDYTKSGTDTRGPILNELDGMLPKLCE